VQKAFLINLLIKSGFEGQIQERNIYVVRPETGLIMMVSSLGNMEIKRLNLTSKFTLGNAGV
jgi:hypothetical protein